MSFYAVAKGKSVGIFSSWNDCQEQVKGCKGAVFKKFASHKEAEDFIAEKTGKPFPPTQKSAPKPAEARAGVSEMGNQLRTGVSKTARMISPLPLPTSNPARAAITFNVRRELYEAKRELSLLKARITLSPEAESSFSSVEQRLASAIKFLNGEDDEASGREKTFDTGPPKPKSWRDDKFLTEGRRKTTTLNSDGFFVDGDGFVHVYTDGACSDNGKGLLSKAGIGVWWAPDHPLNLSEPVSGSKATNNSAEIQAAIRAIEVARENSIAKLWIQTDSMFLINCITKWIDGWKRNGWMTSSSKPVINKDDLVRLDNLLNSDQTFTVRWGYVAGHKGIEGNEGADELARAGAVKYNRKRKWAPSAPAGGRGDEEDD